ncbi:hypothetical protein PAPYR_1450 [Paratrimastix pyriformis]|uniref:Uncharacterized protein n=1 Tax=Paratrimastix pyriformis TaxID=342808 RepID=A0ABQ8USY5_9EUKA|nr:hypothetical protein PAPYR_1450 [Paratrimastix pyriformis]
MHKRQPDDSPRRGRSRARSRSPEDRFRATSRSEPERQRSFVPDAIDEESRRRRWAELDREEEERERRKTAAQKKLEETARLAAEHRKETRAIVSQVRGKLRQKPSRDPDRPVDDDDGEPPSPKQDKLDYQYVPNEDKEVLESALPRVDLHNPRTQAMIDAIEAGGSSLAESGVYVAVPTGRMMPVSAVVNTKLLKPTGGADWRSMFLAKK